MSDYFKNPLYDLKQPDLPPASKSPNLKAADPRTLEHPAAMIDKRNGWEERGSPELGFEEEPEPITLAADELARLFQWLLLGGENKPGPRPAQARDMTGAQLEKVLRRPTIIAARVLAMLLRVRPDLLDGMEAKDVAAKLRISPRMMAFYTMNFSEHFPVGSKSIRRTSKTVSKRIRESRHIKACHGR